MYQASTQVINSDQIVVVGHWPPPYGGITSHLKLLLPKLVESGYQVTLLDVNLNSSGLEPFYENNISIFRINVRRFFVKNFITILKDNFQKFSYLRFNNFKLFFYGASLSSALNLVTLKNPRSGSTFLITHGNDNALVSLFLKGIPNLYQLNTLYAAFYLHPSYYFPYKSLFRAALQRSDYVLSCSNFCVQSASKFLNINCNSHVFYNNVDHLRFTPDNSFSLIRDKHNISHDSFVLLFMGRMYEEMGLNFLLENFSVFLHEFPNLVLLIAGASGPLSFKVSSMSHQFPTSFKSQCNIPDSDKPYYYSACDVFTAPTIDKNACMGISNIEAMMSGKPVLSSRSGGHSETIDDQHSGFLIPFDVDGTLSLSSYISKLRLLYASADLRRHMGSHARERAVKLFSNDHIVEEHIHFFESLKLS